MYSQPQAAKWLLSWLSIRTCLKMDLSSEYNDMRAVYLGSFSGINQEIFFY